MNLASWWRAVRTRWFSVLLITIISVAAGIALCVVTNASYEASAQIFVSASSSDSLDQLAQGNTFAQARVQSYTSVATSPDVTGPVIEKLGLQYSETQLAKKISASAPLNKVLIDLSVTDPSGAEAAKIANAVATQLSSVIEGLEQTNQTTSSSPVKLTVIQPAVVPTSPVSPNIPLIVSLALIVGLILGVGFAVVRSSLDNAVRGVSDLAVIAGSPVLTVVPFDKRTTGAPLAMRADPHGSRSEAYRQLRTNLQFINVDHPPRVFTVTSAIPGEGKTTTAINLASALAEAGNKTCLIEADLRRPTIAKVLGLVSEVGLTSVLIGEAEVEDVFQNAGDNLAVMTAGRIPPNPSELLLADAMRGVISYISERVDFIVIDSAPLLAVADGAVVASLADATVLTVRSGGTKREQVRRAIESLERVGVRPVGSVLNMSQSKGADRYSYYYYGYAPAAAEKNDA